MYCKVVWGEPRRWEMAMHLEGKMKRKERRGWRVGSEKKGPNENVRGLRRILGVSMPK